MAGVYSVPMQGAYNPSGYAQPYFLELRSEQLQISHPSLRLFMCSFVAFSGALIRIQVLEKFAFLGEDVVVISSDKIEGSGDWNSSEFKDTANSGQKKAMIFYQMDTEEVSDRFVAPCFINGLEAYDEAKEEEKSNDDWDHLLDFNIDDVPLLGEEGLLPFICKMGKSSRNKKRAMENLNFFYQDIGTSSSVGGHLTQEEAAKEAIAIRMSQKFALLEEERPIIETMAYHDKYKKILDEVWKDKVELDGKIVKEEEEAVKRIKGEALKEKDDPEAFIFPIRLEGQVNENALADTGLDINTMPYRIYEQLGREDMKKVDRRITMINHTQAEAMGILINILCQVGVTTLIAKFLILDIPIDRDSPLVVGRGFLRKIGGIVNTPERLFSTFDGFCHQTFHAARSDVMRKVRNVIVRRFVLTMSGKPEISSSLGLVACDSHSLTLLEFAQGFGLSQAVGLGRRHQNGYANVAWVIARWMKWKGAGTQKESQICCGQFISKLARKCRVLTEDMVRSLSALIYCRDLDTTTLRDLIDSKGWLIPEDPQGAYNPSGYAQP
ncbi:agenet domain-containing protein [Tanacetum coccineum]|uniref:Agenet domain-containing protein n=1 Tax=Tanacetum coccineum TaxID=301880 RepID=A0ABQ5B0T1_9ASTR